MHKKYTIEVPLYCRSVDYLAKMNGLEDIRITVFGSIPNSPFNGGRLNYSLDGLFLWDRPLFGLNQKQLENVMEKFYTTVSKINEKGMTFYAACTNMFASEEELTEANLYPIQWLVESGQKHGIKNGIVLTNALLEERVRRICGDKLEYISSCTKYFLPNKMLSPRDTKTMYLEDVGKYDYVVMTPQDSRREKLVKDVVHGHNRKIIVIPNSYCANGCNAHHHYACISKNNKTSLLSKSVDMNVLKSAIEFLPDIPKCSAIWHIFLPVDVEKIATMQLNAGAVNFKVGRGFGVEKLEKFVELILKFNAVQPAQAVV